MRVNLIEKERSIFAINWWRVILTIIFAVLMMSMVFNYYLKVNNIRSLENEINMLKEEITMYKPKKDEYYSLEKKIEELKSKPKINIPDYTWGESIRQLGFIIPARAMLTNVVINGDKITFSGRAYQAEDLREFKNNLISSSLFQSVDLYKLIKEEEIVFEIEALVMEGVN